MIFAAGLGTRLKPITDSVPKALAPLNGKPLLWHAIKSMERANIERIVVNVHHFSDLVINYLKLQEWNTEVLISDESDCLLETGGGLLKAQSLFIPNKPVLVKNVDIVTSTNIESFIHSHQKEKNHATLMVKKRSTSRYLLFDNQNNLCGWKNIKTNELIRTNELEEFKSLAFSGMHIIEPELLAQMGEVRPFSIIKAYLELANKCQIKAYVTPADDIWLDVGTVEKLREAEYYFKSGKIL